jgi:hypothetical protein
MYLTALRWVALTLAVNQVAGHGCSTITLQSMAVVLQQFSRLPQLSIQAHNALAAVKPEHRRQWQRRPG